MTCSLTDRLFNILCDSWNVAEWILLRTVTRTLGERYGTSLGEVLYTKLVTDHGFTWCFACRSGRIPEINIHHTMLLAQSSYHWAWSCVFLSVHNSLIQTDRVGIYKTCFYFLVFLLKDITWKTNIFQNNVTFNARVHSTIERFLPSHRLFTAISTTIFHTYHVAGNTDDDVG
jgi:hypothetical protein